MVLFPPIVSLLLENGGAILVDCLITDHRTAARPAVTIEIALRLRCVRLNSIWSQKNVHLYRTFFVAAFSFGATYLAKKEFLFTLWAFFPQY